MENHSNVFYLQRTEEAERNTLGSYSCSRRQGSGPSAGSQDGLGQEAVRPHVGSQVKANPSPWKLGPWFAW